MDHPIHIDAISMELSSLYSKGIQVKISIKLCISVPEDCLISAKSTGTDKIPPYAALDIGLYCLLNYILTLKAPITTAADDKLSQFRKKKIGMIFHENRLPADDSHEISCLIRYF